MDVVVEYKSWPQPRLHVSSADNEGRDKPFQRRAWEILRTIRVGGVVTHAALARRVGAPDAVGAVANACAKSPFALAIDGDRVVRTGDAV
jgi:O-6-methylguanine DNA methyltransferase